jgi:predicted transcriptional regulator
MENKSLFLEFFGGSPTFKVIDFLLEHRLEDFTKTEIAKGADVSWATLFKCWDELEKYKIVKLIRVVGRARLYQLNESSPIVKELKAMELALIKQAADEEEEKVKMKIKARK